MNEAMIHNWNQRVKPEDVVYHLGDFCWKLKNNNKTCNYWESKLNGKIIHIQGNHDNNNGTKTQLIQAHLEFGGKNVLIRHKPIYMSNARILEGYDMVLVGHVHKLWRYRTLKKGRKIIPVINLSADVIDFKPLKISEILKMYDKIIKENKKGKK